MLAVSDLALIIFAAADGSFDQDGMSPHRIDDSSRTGSFGFWRMTATGWVGAMLYRGDPAHGAQQLSFFNGHYDTWCYLPVMGFVSFNASGLNRECR